MAHLPELTAEQLRFCCSEDEFNFATTETVPPLEGMLGQERAVKAVEFGLFTKNPGYNIFMSGIVGTGKLTYAKKVVTRVARGQDTPDDWLYVNNFDNASQPLVLHLPPGLGRKFRDDMRDLLEDLKTEIPKVFSGDEYEQAKADVIKKMQNERSQIIDTLNTMAQAQGVLPQWTPTGFVGVPLKDDKPLSPEEYQKLPEEERQALEKKMLAVHEKAMDTVRRMQILERQARDELKDLDSKIGLFATGHLIEKLQEKYRAYPQVANYLERVKKEIVANIGEFKPAAQDEEQNNPLVLFQRTMMRSMHSKFQVNLLVDNKNTQGAPVVVETNPTYYNLIGRVEYENRMGVVSTDFNMIKPGALHRANGGYLILNARDVLTNPMAWEALKRVLKTKLLYIENMGEQFGMITMASLKPQPIPINVKVILIGNPLIYQLLFNYDEDFHKLFKIRADFDVVMENTPENRQKLAGFISSTVQRDKLSHFDRQAVAKVAEYCTRITGTQKKLTTRFNEVVELLTEADAWSRLAESDVVTAAHVRKAIEEKRHRANIYEEKLQEMFKEGTILLDTDGEKVGQVNGLAVLAVGEYMFGKPSRITANTFLGRGGVINIERETKMSGTTHSKGVLILSGYLGRQYAQRRPLTLSASLTFEQLYDGVDGDSASSTELYAILSSLADLPLKQYIAVTGSVNQKGEVQPIGGVTQKIEGYFAVCKLKGLTGKQGVMIPYQNIPDLVLNDEVMDAVRQGQFHIYPVRTIDEGIEILTGVPAGERQPDGSYPPDTVHGRVERQLREYTETMLRMSRAAEEKAADKEKTE